MGKLRATIAFRLHCLGTSLGGLYRLAYRLLGMRIGRNTSIGRVYFTWPHQVSIGSSCIIEHNVYFHYDGIYKPGPSIVVGDGVFIGAGVEFNARSMISIGSRSLIAAGSRFIDHDHNIRGIDSFEPIDGRTGAILIDDDVWIGANTAILRGVSIGRGSVVGAGSVVTKPIPGNEIWAGVPARKIGQRSMAP